MESGSGSSDSDLRNACEMSYNVKDGYSIVHVVMNNVGVRVYQNQASKSKRYFTLKFGSQEISGNQDTLTVSQDQGLLSM